MAILGLSLGLALAGSAAVQPSWIEDSWPDAMTVARRTHKPIMALFVKRGCGPCAMQDTTLQAPEVSAYAGTFVCVRFDLEGPVGKEMARRFKVMGSPNTVFFNGEGEEQDRVVGPRPPDVFLAEMKRVRAGRETVPDLLANAARRADDVDFQFLLGSKLSDRGDARARPHLERVLALDSTNAHGRADNALLALSSLARRDSDYTSAAAALERLLRHYPGSESADLAFHGLARCYKDLGRMNDAFAVLERSVAAEPDDPWRWNDLAWNLVEWKGDLDRALAAATRAADLSHQDLGILDTLAEVYYARGEYDLAIETEKIALGKAPGDEGIQERLHQFESVARAAKASKK